MIRCTVSSHRPWTRLGDDLRSVAERVSVIGKAYREGRVGGCQLLWGNEMTGASNKGLVLAAMVFAVAMTFIDQTIVAIAIPNIQKELSLSATGVAVGHQRLPAGAVGAVRVRRQARRRARPPADGGDRRDRLRRSPRRAAASPRTGSIGAGVDHRLPGAPGCGAALMFPAAVAIVVASFPLRERGTAMAIFFGITGGLTAIGPIAGGYLDAVDLARRSSGSTSRSRSSR